MTCNIKQKKKKMGTMFGSEASDKDGRKIGKKIKKVGKRMSMFVYCMYSMCPPLSLSESNILKYVPSFFFFLCETILLHFSLLLHHTHAASPSLITHMCSVNDVILLLYFHSFSYLVWRCFLLNVPEV